VTATLVLPAISFGAISIDLGVPNAALSVYPGPYATLTVDRTDATHAIITLTRINPAGNDDYLIGNGSSLALNVNGSYSIVGDTAAANIQGITTTQPADAWFDTPGPFDYPNSLPANVSDFGSFSLVIDNFDGAKHSASSMSFTLLNTSGTWSSDSDVLVNNAAGFQAATHIFVFDQTNYSAGAVVTGFAGNGTLDEGPLLPEPTSIVAWLLGAGGLGFILRRRMSKAAA